MRESPVAALINMPWWINLLIGLGMLAFGELLKISGGSGQAPGKVAFGQSIQFFSIIFLCFAAICFILSCFRDASGANARKAGTVPPPPRPEEPKPAAPPPPPKKRKYTDRDFMPAALRAELDAKEALAAPAPPSRPAPPPPPPPAKKEN